MWFSQACLNSLRSICPSLLASISSKEDLVRWSLLDVEIFLSFASKNMSDETDLYSYKHEWNILELTILSSPQRLELHHCWDLPCKTSSQYSLQVFHQRMRSTLTWIFWMQSNLSPLDQKLWRHALPISPNLNVITKKCLETS